jgi:hypothetical protein
MKRPTSLAGVVALTIAISPGQVEGPFTLPAQFNGRKFRQVKVGDCSLPLPGASAAVRRPKLLKTGDVSIRLRPQARLQIGGIDRGGNRWSVTIHNQPAGCSVWRSDLDGNGNDDLIVITSDLTSGPGVEVTLLMIDHEKRPVPWQAFGYFDADHAAGLDNIVDLNGDGRAELLYLHVEGERLETGASSLAIYSAADAQWQLNSGVYEGFSFPIRTPKGARPTREPDLSNARRAGGSRITSLVPGKPENCGLQLPILRDGESARIDADAAKAMGESCFERMVLAGGKMMRVPAIVVMDDRGGRAIALEPAEQSKILAEINRRGFAVQVVGRTCDSGCRPFFLWASRRR